MKKTVIIGLLVILYLRGLVHGYLAPLRAGRMFATALLYIVMHYITLSWRSAVHRYGWRIAASVGIIAVIIFGFTNNAWLAVSSVLRHAALFSVVYSLEEVVSNRRTFKSSEFFRTGGTLFSIFFTLSFIFAFIGRNQDFSLTCEDITKASTSLLRYTEQGLTAGIHQLPFRSNDSTPMDPNIGMVTGTQNPSFLDVLQIYKTQLIDDTLFNQKNVSQKVCGVFLDQIKELYMKPGFRVSLIVTMFLFLSPLLRISLFVISGLNMLIFALLKKAKVYSIGKETVEVDKVL